MEIVSKAIFIILVLVKTYQKDDSQNTSRNLTENASVMNIESLSKELNSDYCPNYLHQNEEYCSGKNLLKKKCMNES